MSRARTACGALLALTAACGGGAEAGGPPDVSYGLDVCSRCGMVIDDPRFAAALREPDGGVRLYDDVGELIAEVEEARIEVADVWLHDYDDGGWLRAAEATLIRGDRPTPMGSGLCAFRSRAAAQRWAAEHGGTVLTRSGLGHDVARSPNASPIDTKTIEGGNGP